MMESPKSCPFWDPFALECFADSTLRSICASDKNFEICPVYLQMKKRKDKKLMENKTLEKVLDVAGSATKLAANLSEPKKDPPKTIPVGDSDNSNRASTGSQNIQIHMDTGKKKEPKPIEKHIHEFPENRPLTTEECDLALKRAQMEYDLKMQQEAYFQKSCDREWNHQMEVERKNEKKGKIRRIIGGILVAIGAGSIGYSIYADYRDHRNQAMAPKALPEASVVKADGEVK